MKKTIRNQKGIALVIVILLLVALTTLGVMAVNVSNVGTKITSNTKTSKQAFYLAEGGIERARELLRTQRVAGTTLSSMLTTAANGGTLTNSTTNPSFSGSNNTPFVASTSLGPGSFKVYLTNDSGEGVTSTADSNNIVTLTSIGSGPDNALAVVQVRTSVNSSGGSITLPNLPGAITLSGPTATFYKGSSNAASIAGGATHPAVAVNAASSRTSVVNNITTSPNRSGVYTGTGGSPSVQNLVFGSPWDSISDLNSLVSSLTSVAHYTSTGAAGFTWGTTADRKIVVINGDLTIGPVTGAGIILCTGNLSIHGNFNYDGMILAVGNGSITRHGGGNGTINGGLFVANTKGTDGLMNTADDAFGNTTYDTSGGGNSNILYNSASQTAASTLANSFPATVTVTKTSWQQY